MPSIANANKSIDIVLPSTDHSDLAAQLVWGITRAFFILFLFMFNADIIMGNPIKPKHFNVI